VLFTVFPKKTTSDSQQHSPTFLYSYLWWHHEFGISSKSWTVVSKTQLFPYPHKKNWEYLNLLYGVAILKRQQTRDYPFIKLLIPETHHRSAVFQKWGGQQSPRMVFVIETWWNFLIFCRIYVYIQGVFTKTIWFKQDGTTPLHKECGFGMLM